MGAPFFHGGINRIKHRIQFLLDLMVPEAQHPIALRCQPSVAFEVMCDLPIVTVLPAIQLDDEFQPVRSEIRIIPTDGNLLAEVSAFERNTPEVVPKNALLVRHRRTQAFCRNDTEPV